MKRTLALCVAFGLVSLAPALAGEIRERRTFFMVRGQSFDELNRQLGEKGPDLGHGARHAGSTDVTFEPNSIYKAVPGGCVVDRAQVKLDLHTNLPRWSAPSSSTRDTRILWKALRDEIATHEAEHSRIAKSWLKRIEATIRSLPAERDCAAMEAKVNGELRSLIKLHDVDQLAFDAAETKRIDARVARKLQENAGHLAKR